MCPTMSAVAPQSCGMWRFALWHPTVRDGARCALAVCGACLHGHRRRPHGTPSTAAMVKFSGQGAAKRAATITTAAQAVGFAAALLLGGALIQYAPMPTRLNFWALSAVLAALFAAAWFLPRHTGSQARGRWRPKTPFIPNRLRKVFAVATAAVTTAYTHGVLILSDR